MYWAKTTARACAGKLLLGLALLCACRAEGPGQQSADGKLSVYVSIPPQKFFVERIGGDRVSVSVLVPPGQSPATYELTPRQMVQLSKARAYFRVGVPFEKQVVAKVGSTLKELNIVDTRKGIELKKVTEPCQHDDHGEAGHHHHHSEQDPHIWMNPRLVKVQARTICRELVRLDPDNKSAFESNLQSFLAELDRADKQIATVLAPLRGREFYVFHPAFGYFADAYGLEQVAVEAAGKQPTAKQLGAVIERAKKAGVKLMFVQPQFAKSSAEAVMKEIGGAVVPMDPLAEDYVSNLLDVASKIQKALAPPSVAEGSN